MGTSKIVFQRKKIKESIGQEIYEKKKKGSWIFHFTRGGFWRLRETKRDTGEDDLRDRFGGKKENISSQGFLLRIWERNHSGKAK